MAKTSVGIRMYSGKSFVVTMLRVLERLRSEGCKRVLLEPTHYGR